MLFIFIIFVTGAFVALFFFALQDQSPFLFGENRIALVRIEGVIYDAVKWVDQIEDYQDDDSIKAIVLRVDSPGGAVTPSQEIFEAVQTARQDYHKVVVASFGSVAASGGYYAACNADRIVSAPGALTGSIGVYIKFLIVKDLFEKIGIDYETIKGGKFKDFGSMERGLSDEEREMMEEVTDDIYLQFIEAVAQGRRENITKLLMEWDESDASEDYPFSPETMAVVQTYRKQYKEKKKELEDSRQEEENETDDFWSKFHSLFPPVQSADSDDGDNPESAEDTLPPDFETILNFVKTIAEGKVYTGRQAKKIALVDEIGTLDDAIKLAAALVGIKGDVTLVEKEASRPFDLIDLISEKVTNFVNPPYSAPIQYRFPFN